MSVKSCHLFIATTHRSSRFLQLFDAIEGSQHALVSGGKERSEQDRPNVDDQSLLLDFFAQFPQTVVVELGLREEVGSDDDLLRVEAWLGEARRKGQVRRDTFSAPASSHSRAFESVIPPPR